MVRSTVSLLPAEPRFCMSEPFPCQPRRVWTYPSIPADTSASVCSSKSPIPVPSGFFRSCLNGSGLKPTAAAGASSRPRAQPCASSQLMAPLPPSSLPAHTHRCHLRTSTGPAKHFMRCVLGVSAAKSNSVFKAVWKGPELGNCNFIGSQTLGYCRLHRLAHTARSSWSPT